MAEREITILIIEDDDGHARLIKEGLKKGGILNNILRFANGKDGWEFLKKEANGNKYLILLDINMPVMDGVELLKLIKANDKLKKIPVIMLTTTDDPREIELCYELGCNIYITKPVDFTNFMEALKRVGLFVQIVDMPKVE